MSVHDDIAIDISPLCGDNGVFCIAEGGIPPNEAISIYPGYYRLISRNTGAPPLKYCISIHPATLPDPDVTEEWVIDASRIKYSKTDGVGHLINSCHPGLPPPYNKHNCVFIEESPDEYTSENRPPLVFVVTSSYIPEGGELLMDYHDLLEGMHSPITNSVLHCSCFKCV